MKKYFPGFCLTAILLSWVIAFAGAYPSDPQVQRSKNKADTASDTRIQRSNQPILHKTDSLPSPKTPMPVPTPMPDSLPTKY